MRLTAESCELAGLYYYWFRMEEARPSLPFTFLNSNAITRRAYFHLLKLWPYDREQKQVSENYVVFPVGGILQLKIIMVSSVHKLLDFIL